MSLEDQPDTLPNWTSVKSKKTNRKAHLKSWTEKTLAIREKNSIKSWFAI